METTCKNCEVPVRPDYDYCPKCSQKVHLHRLSLHEVFHEAVHYFTHADKGLFQLIRDLAFKRGAVAREYIAGKRKKYFPPLNFFLLVAALNLFVVNVDDPYQKLDFIKDHPELIDIKDPHEKKLMMHIYEKQYNAAAFMKKHYNLVIMCLLPMMAFAFWIFYRKSRYNFTEHLIAGMYMYGFCSLVCVIALLLNLIFRIDNNYIYFCAIILELVYFSNFYYTFMNDGRKFRPFAASLCALLASFAGSGIVTAIYAMV